MMDISDWFLIEDDNGGTWIRLSKIEFISLYSVGLSTEIVSIDSKERAAILLRLGLAE